MMTDTNSLENIEAGFAAADDYKPHHVRPGGIFKISNDYAEAISDWLYAHIPKTVLAAIVVSIFSDGGERMEHIDSAILEEWQTLHDNGIVPQKPPKGVQS